MLILICIFSVFGIIIWFATWLTHIIMSMQESYCYGWGNYDKFIRQFNLHNNWHTDIKFKNSFFGAEEYHDKYEIHAEIIKFDNKCMILDPISYLLFKLFCHDTWNELNKNKIKKVKWQ